MDQGNGRRDLPPQYAALADLLARLPVPSHPPRYRREGAEYGAAFLDMAIRQNHLLRMSELLRFEEVANLSRTVTVDVSLDRLTTGQLAAARAFAALRRHHREGPVDRAARPDLAWIAIARLPRADTTPVDVLDAEGRAVPRLTQDESRGLLNASLYRVLRMILESHPDQADAGSALRLFLDDANRARWLLQTAIAHLVERATAPDTGRSVAADTPAWLLELHAAQAAPGGRATSDHASAEARELATLVLAQYLRTHHRGFFELLDVAVSDYLLVVGVDAGRSEHILRFEGPMLSADSDSAVNRKRHRLGNALPWSAHELVVEYVSELPPGLKSYHVSIEVDPSVRCRRFLQRTSADAPIQRSAVTDLRAIAEHVEQRRRAGTEAEPKLIEYELQSAVQRVGRLVQARLEDFGRYRSYLYRNDVVLTPTEERSALSPDGGGDAQPWARRLLPVRARRPDASTSFADLARLATDHGAGRLTRLFDTDDAAEPSPFREPDRLRDFATAVEGLQLGDDATADNDPRENGARAYWSRRDWPDEVRTSRTIRSAIRFTVADDAPSLSGSVARMIAILIATYYAIFAFIFGPGWVLRPTEEVGTNFQADAVITVMLLVPGLLLARLDLPATNTVVGYLRAAPRALAYVSAGVMVAVAIGTAAGLDRGDSQPWWAPTGLALLVAAFLLAAVGSLRSRRRRTASLLDSLDPPLWLRQLTGSSARRPEPDVAFTVRLPSRQADATPPL